METAAASRALFSLVLEMHFTPPTHPFHLQLCTSIPNWKYTHYAILFSAPEVLHRDVCTELLPRVPVYIRIRTCVCVCIYMCVCI